MLQKFCELRLDKDFLNMAQKHKINSYKLN